MRTIIVQFEEIEALEFKSFPCTDSNRSEGTETECLDARRHSLPDQSDPKTFPRLHSLRTWPLMGSLRGKFLQAEMPDLQVLSTAGRPETYVHVAYMPTSSPSFGF